MPLKKTPPDARQDQLSGAQRYAFLPIFPNKMHLQLQG